MAQTQSKSMKTQSKTIKTGTLVFIKCPDSWEYGNWGIVRAFDGQDYHVAMNDGDTQLVFDRSELRVPKRQQ